MANRKVEKIGVYINDEKIGEITSFETNIKDIGNPEIFEGQTMQGNIPCKVTFFNEQWFLAYQARMYANLFRN